MNIEFLPLKSYSNIVEGNALRIDWETVVPKEKLNYIMGNPPFVGYAYQTLDQKEDLAVVLDSGVGKNIDYVAGWYFKASLLMKNTNIRTAFVSTNSITQGEQVASVWKPLYDKYNIHIDFAHRTFRWDSEASIKAHVHCVIVGFSIASNPKQKQLYTSERVQLVDNINSYLIAAPNVFIESNNRPLCEVLEILKGSSAVDDGNFFFSDDEYQAFVSIEPQAAEYIKPFLGAREYLHNVKRWCLWLVKISPNVLKTMPNVLRRVEAVRSFRLASKKEATRKYADYPTRFMEIRQPTSDYILIPRHSSENRKYVPLGYMSKDIICGDANNMLPEATLYHFGVLTSNVHMSWMRTVSGRLEMRYRYSNDIVYNNFPWCNPTDAQKANIEQTAQAILDARALYPDCSLADLYDELTMPVELRNAHRANDKAVMEAYGFDVKTMTESSCVAELMKMYQKLTR